MTAETLLRRFHELACLDPETELDADSLIGFFQAFRPDGAAINGLYDDLHSGDGRLGDRLMERLSRLYAAAGDDRRPEGGRDAYFVIRRPPPIDPGHAEQLAQQWLQGVRRMAIAADQRSLAAMLDPLPEIRVLEGLPPKHPKDPDEKAPLLRFLQQDAPTLVHHFEDSPYPPVLRQAYYFTTCDTMVRDYLMWPFYEESSGLEDPLWAYFELWRHGIKYRIFHDSRVNLYLPRHATGAARLD